MRFQMDTVCILLNIQKVSLPYYVQTKILKNNRFNDCGQFTVEKYTILTKIGGCFFNTFHVLHTCWGLL